MSITLMLTDEEVNLLRSMHQRDLSTIQLKIDELISKKSHIETRLLELSQFKTKALPIEETVLNESNSSYPKQSGLFGGEVLDSYNTLGKRMWYTYKTVENSEYSTGECYAHLVEYFPSEKQKNKNNLIASISTELGKGGKDGKTFVKTQNKDANGKWRFKLNKI